MPAPREPRRIELSRADGAAGEAADTRAEAAMRIAREHGIPPETARAAADALRARTSTGPERPSANMLQVVPVPASDPPPPATRVPEPEPADRARAAEIVDIQRDIARRRHRRQVRLLARLAVLVALPTLLVGFYYARIATTLYETHDEIVIEQADPMGASGTVAAVEARPRDSIAV